MDNNQAVFLYEAIGGFLTLAGGGIAIYVKHVKDTALLEQANKYTQNQVDKLEARVNDMENNLYEKLDLIITQMNEMNIAITKLQK